MCSHEEVIDDFREGVTVCLDCRRVLAESLAVSEWEKGPPLLRKGREADWHIVGPPNTRFPSPPPLPPSPVVDVSANYQAQTENREKLRCILSHLHLDNAFVVERTLSLFNRIYGERKNIRKNNKKEKIALAFSILNTLTAEGFPRPVDYVVKICQLENPGQLLHLDKILKVGKERVNDYQLTSPPAADFVDVICAHFNIPYQAMKNIKKDVELCDLLYENKPMTIVGAILQEYFKKENNDNVKTVKQRVCQELGCRQHSIDKLSRRFVRWENGGKERKRRKKRRRGEEEATIVVTKEEETTNRWEPAPHL